MHVGVRRRRPALDVLTMAGVVVVVSVLGLAFWAVGTESPPPGNTQDSRAEIGTTEAAGPPWLATSGNRIVVAGTGDEVVLRGANVLRSEWDLSMEAERSAFPVLAEDWGGNVAVRGFASDPVLQQDEDYLKMLDEHVELARAYGMYVVFAWRSHTVNGPQPSAPDDRAEQALVALAERYYGQSHVAYALQVEPHDVTWSDVQPLFVRMTDAIRQASAPYEPLIMVPGVDWGRDVSGALSQPVERPNIVYKAHVYNPEATFDRYFLDVHDAGLPVFIGEFGLLPEQEMYMEDVNALLDVAHNRRLGWAAWAMDFQGGPGLVEDNAAFRPTQPYGAAVRDAMVETTSG